MVTFGEKIPISVAPLLEKFILPRKRKTYRRKSAWYQKRKRDRAAMTANSAGIFAAPRVNITGLCLF